MNEPETDLIVKATHGDATAQEQLLRPFEQPLFLYLLRLLGQRQDAEDALQNTYIKTLRALPKYRHEGHFRSWLYRIAHREGLQLIRKRPGEKQESEARLHEQPDHNPHPDDQAHHKNVQHLVREAIATLPIGEREVVTLRLDAELSFKEIANATNIPLGTALSRMRQALVRLKPLLETIR